MGGGPPRGVCAGLAEAYLGAFDPMHGAKRDAKPARLARSVTAAAVISSPLGKDVLWCAIGEGTPLRMLRFAWVAASAMAEKCGVLLRTQTKAVHAPPGYAAP